MNEATERRPKHLRLLLVEDSDSDMLLLLHELEQGGFDVSYTRVQSLPELREALRHDWQLVISDYSLPTMTAADVLKMVAVERPYVPCIVMSGTITEEAAVDLLRLGARDFVVKHRAYRLVPAIERELHEAEQRRMQREAEAALNETQERMRFILEAVGVGVWEADVRTGSMRWSDVLERLHGLQPGSFAGTYDAYLAAIHPDDREQVEEQIRQAIRDRTDTRLTYRALRPDGTVRWLEGIGRLLLDEQGEPRGAVGVELDVTQQRQAEEQLRQVQKMESIGNLAGAIAHDFNNLLTIIGGYTDLGAAMTPHDSTLAEYFQAIRAAVTSATALTARLLTFSRRQVLRPEVIDLNEMLSGFSKLLVRLIEESVRIAIVPARHLPPVRLDPSQLEQIVLNLVANARDAMPTGGTITISTGRVELHSDAASQKGVAPGVYVTLTVRDTGTGMPPSVQAQIFEPFFTTKPRGQGTGLGLPTVHGIVKGNGGAIELESTEGVGTTFTLYFPAVGVTRTEAEVREEALAEFGGAETILVVEDNAALRRLTVRMLERYGYTVLVAENFARAQALCGEHSGAIDVAILDVIMPDGSGPEVAEWLTRAHPATRVVFVSGYTDDTFDLQRVREMGAVLLQKPYTAPQLASVIRSVLSTA